MQLLLDTQAFLWWVEDSPRLSRRARRAIAEPGNDCWLSLVSCWEMAIKVSLGKLRLRPPLKRFVPEQLGANGFRLLEVDLRRLAHRGIAVSSSRPVRPPARRAGPW
jgi:PIN domain nuclease of toxin-antitoxin system